MPNEIITLQLGRYANYVGTHWWNIQESAFAYQDGDELSESDPDAMFREGETLRGETTFTPRLVLVDTKDSLATLPSQGSLYNEESYGEEDAHYLWDNGVDVHQSKALPKNQFLQDLQKEELQAPTNGFQNGHSSNCSSDPKSYAFEKVVSTWSDYKRIHYHPRTTILIDSNPVDKSKLESFHFGYEEAKTGTVLNEIEESVRFFAEECDALQGFHILCNMDDAFGGMACSVSEYINDEFGRNICACFPVLHPPSPLANVSKLRNRSLSNLLTLEGLLETSGFVVPLSVCQELFKSKAKSFPHLIYNAQLEYHTSAVLAASLECMTRAYRSRSRRSSVSDIVVNMVSGSRKLLELSSSLPLPYDHISHECFADFLCDYSDSMFYHSLTPYTSAASPVVKTFSQNVSLMGLTSLEFVTPAHLTEQSALHQCSNPTAMIKMYMKERFQNSQCSVTVVEEAMKTLTPYPQIFSECVQFDGSITTMKKPSKFSDQYTEFLLNGNSSTTSSKKQLQNGHGDKASPNSVSSVPMMTVLEASTSVGQLLKQSYEQGIMLRKWHARLGNSDTESHLDETIEKLQTLERDYQVCTEFSDDDSSD
uniref:Protein misato homolog 1 n=1 Tax=Phallusia mammillata TaxID=59560 RepID=A0A6F9DM87_9ASCI|nr:protein misato homolog 1 [Phallusia mammillata]